MTAPASFSFLNQERTLQSATDWNRKEWPPLWRYHLHYFDDLNAVGAGERAQWHRALMLQWISENPVGQGTGWEPYPTSLRIVNWIKWLLCNDCRPSDFRQSVAIQVRTLVTRLEYHLLGNHLWANAKALIFAGCYFDGPEATTWRMKGLSILADQLDEQILDDGGHFERSPMYHSIVLEDVLDLIQLGRLYFGMIDERLMSRLQHKCAAMFSWLRGMTHSDGDIAFFNDSCLGQAPTRDELSDYAAELGLPLTARLVPVLHLERSGFLASRAGIACLIADVGSVGPDYQPGHAHAETLAFELSLAGRRLFVNSGIDRYEDGSERIWQRGTAAHNTVQVDGENSSEVWKSFRVARRARVLGLELKQEGSRILMQCGHDGYKRLPGRVIHHRRWLLSETGLKLVDRLDGKFQSAISRLYLHPDVDVLFSSATSTRLEIGKFVIELECVGADLSVHESRYFPYFGRACANKCLHFTFGVQECEVAIKWSAKTD